MGGWGATLPIVTTLPRVAAALACLALLLPVAACSGSVSIGSSAPEIDQAALEEDLLGNITGDGADQVDVTCEGPLVAEVGATQDCAAVFAGDDTRTGIRPTVTGVEGEAVDYDSVVFIDGDSMADTVGRQLRAQAFSFGSVECGELLGERGATGECVLTARSGTETSLETTVTEVNGLRVDVEFEEA